jgi:hypothetical protein
MQARHKITEKKPNLRGHKLLTLLIFTSCLVISCVRQATERDCLNSNSQFPNVKSRAKISRSPLVIRRSSDRISRPLYKQMHIHCICRLYIFDASEAVFVLKYEENLADTVRTWCLHTVWLWSNNFIETSNRFYRQYVTHCQPHMFQRLNLPHLHLLKAIDQGRKGVTHLTTF